MFLVRRKLVPLALLAFMLAGQGVSGYRLYAEDGPEADEYAVYAALFAEKGDDKQGTQIVLQDVTVVNDRFSGRLDQRALEKLFGLPSIKDAIKDRKSTRLNSSHIPLS